MENAEAFEAVREGGGALDESEVEDVDVAVEAERPKPDPPPAARLACTTLAEDQRQCMSIISVGE